MEHRSRGEVFIIIRANGVLVSLEQDLLDITIYSHTCNA